MSFLWIIVAGMIAVAIATLVMPESARGGLLVLGLGGAILGAGVMYAESQTVNVLASAIGAAALLFLYRITRVTEGKQDATEHRERGEFRKAA